MDYILISFIWIADFFTEFYWNITYYSKIKIFNLSVVAGFIILSFWIGILIYIDTKIHFYLSSVWMLLLFYMVVFNIIVFNNKKHHIQH